ncbi:MAG: chromate efflux transporter [Pseudomonadota bacterium]
MKPISYADLVRIFGRIGFLSFGGPAAQIAFMHRTLVDEQKWLDEDAFLRALSLCMLLPGPEAMQLATYAGWRLRGITGGLIAGLLFVIPGAVLIGVLALFYATYGQVPLVQAAFTGIKAAVFMIVLQALSKVAGKALTTKLAWLMAGAAFVALFVFGVPFPMVIAVAAAIGALAYSDTATPSSKPVPVNARPLFVILIWGALWSVPVLALALFNQDFLLDVALFFSKLAVVTFGGAYAVLAYMTQAVVSDFGWISTDQMIDALGLAETTPGPLILVTQFVAMLAGHKHGGAGLAITAGLLALWVTFVPCFLWIFLAGPYLDQISARPRIDQALKAITAAVVGVILNLALWFGIHVLFNDVATVAGGLAAPRPVLASLDLVALGLTALAAALILGLKRPIVQSLGAMACAGLVAAFVL